MDWLVTHAHGNPNVRSVLKALHARRGKIRFETILAIPNLRIISFLSKHFEIFDRLSLKTYPGLPFRFIKISVSQFIPFAIDKFSQSISAHPEGTKSGVGQQESRLDSRAAVSLLRNRKIEIVYGYQGMCIKQFNQAKKLGLTTILELPNSLKIVRDGITEMESIKFPQWNFNDELQCGREEIYTQEAMELELADWIVVPSQQVKSSIDGLCDVSKIVILPYSVSLHKPTRTILKSARTNRVLIVSRLISTKGIHYLEEATRSLDIDYELFIVGSLPPSPSTELLSFLKRNKYLGNISRNRIVDLMKTCEIFILPSLIEGRSLSSLEAISQGLIPVLTHGTGAGDVVRENGILIPSRSSSAIRESMLSLFTMKSSAKLDMRMHSLEIAESLSENVYLECLDDFFSTVEMSRF